MTATTAEPSAPVPVQAAPRERRVTLRSVAALVCFLLAALLTTPAVVGYWGQRTLTDTQRYLDTVGPLAADPEVQAATAAAITQAFEKNVDVEALVNEAFGGIVQDRPRLQALIPVFAGAVNSFVANAATEVTQSQQFQDLWVKANEVLQTEAIKFLDGETSAVKLVGNQVVLDTSPLIDTLKQRLVDRGLTIVQNIDIPAADRQIVLLTSDQLAQVQSIYTLARPVMAWLILLVAALYLAAVLLARRTGRMVLAVGVALVVNALAMASALWYGESQFVNTLQGTVFSTASDAFYATLFAYLDRAWRVLFWLGVVFAVGGFVAGQNRAGTAVRRFLAGGLEGLGATFGSSLGGAGAAVARIATPLRWASVLVGALVLFWGSDTSVASLVWATAITLALFAVIQFLVGAGRAASAAAPDAAAAAI